jgi:hypothetical protein
LRSAKVIAISRTSAERQSGAARRDQDATENAAPSPGPASWLAPPVPRAELTEDSIEQAVLRHLSRGPALSPEERSPAADAVRLYSFPEVTVLLGAVAIALLALESEGLLAWASRWEVGPTQSAGVWLLSGLKTAAEPIGLTRPRRALIVAGERLARALGTGEDPLLASGWRQQDSVERGERGAWNPSEPEENDPAVGPPGLQRASEPIQEPPAAPPGDKAALSHATLLLVGDSMIAGSLSSALAAGLSTDPSNRVVRAVQTATGLSRPDVFDWMSVVPPLLEREKPQLIICSLGANDATNLRSGGRLVEFGRAGWRNAYAERVAAMMQMLSSGGARVLWLGLPPMREAAFSDRARFLNRIFAYTARQFPQVDYFDLGMLVSGSTGEYATFVRNRDGRFIRMRMDDGVHYSPSGAKVVARWVMDWVRERRGNRTEASD